MFFKRATLVTTLMCCGVASASLVGGKVSTVRAATVAKQATPAKRARRAVTQTDQTDQTDEANNKGEQQPQSERSSAASFAWTARPDAVDMDARADSKRAEAVAKLKRILGTLPDGPQKAELLFRLSEMYWGKSRYMHLRAMQAWDEALQKWNEAGNHGKEPKVEGQPEYVEAQRYRGETVKLYEKILTDYPAYDRKDEVLYNLGSSLYDTGDKKEGVAKYWRLLKQFPSSDFAPDAWLQLGEHFFNANKLPQAIKAYGNAAATNKPRIYSYALYKLAWCDYNLQEYKNALEKFRKVVEYSKQAVAASNADVADGRAPGLGSGDRIQLMEEAYADMVRVYSHLDAVDDAFDYYEREVGEEKAYGYLHRLALLYNQEGKHELEIKMLQSLNDRYPYRPQAPRNQTSIMTAYAQLGARDEVRSEARRLIELYSPNGVWAQRNAGNQNVLDDAFEAVEQELAAVVTEQHRAAQETKLVETYLLARDLYKEYLDKFASSVNSYAFRFYYAEILYGLKQHEEAAEQYTLVVQADRQGKFAKNAAYTSILGWEKVVSGVKEVVGKRMVEQQGSKDKDALKRLEKIETLKKGERYEQTELTAGEKKLADACDLFVEVAPGDDEVVKVKFKSARLYYVHHQFEEAATRFGEIIDRWPDDSLARIGAESIVQSFNVREDWVALNHWSRKFRDDKRLMADAKFKKTIDEFVEGASFNEILFVYEPKADLADTAARYAAFAKEFPESKYVLVALYNAVVNYDKANLLEKAIDQATAILGPYRLFKISDADLEQSKKEGTQLPAPADIREKVLFLRASFFERLAHFETAADLYEQYAAEFKDGPRRPDAIYNAAVFREGLGNYGRAVENFTAYIKDYPDKPDVKELTWRLGAILVKGRDFYGAQQHYEAWIKQYGADDAARKLCAEYRITEGLIGMGRPRDAVAAYPKLLAAYEKLTGDDRQSACALEAAAKAAFEMLEPAFRDYMAIELGTTEKQVAANLTKKLGDVEDLQKSYTQVLSLGHGDYGIASLYRIGQIYRDLADDIFKSPCPRRLDADQCGIYQAMLQEKAFPLEEKSIEAFDKALAKAYELGLYNDWLKQTQDALAAYEAGRFPDVHEYDLIASETATQIPDLVEAY